MVYRQGSIDFASIAADAFGNAIGEKLAYIGNSGSSGGSSYQDGDIGRSELRFDDGPVAAFPTFSQLAGGGGFGDGTVQPVDRSQDILLTAGPGYAGLGRDTLKLSTPVGDDMDLAMQGMLYDIARDQAKQGGRANFLAAEAQATSNLYADGAGGVRTIRTLSESLYEPVQRITAEDLSLSPAGVTLQDIQPLPALSFQEVNDQRVLAGTYDRNQQLGQAWSDGRYGDVWRHINFEASDAGKAAVNARLFPQVSPGMARIDQMLNSPVGAILYGASRWAGASQSTQDAWLTTGGILEGVGGGLVGIRTPGRVSQQGPLARVRTGDAPRRGVVEFGGLEVRAVRDLSHVDVGTLRAMQQYGFAAKDINGNSLVLHHHRQNPAGPIIEMPGVNHKIGNPAQHPFGNTKGAGLTAEQRENFNQWRVDYWKWRATQELLRREIP